MNSAPCGVCERVLHHVSLQERVMRSLFSTIYCSLFSEHVLNSSSLGVNSWSVMQLRGRASARGAMVQRIDSSWWTN